MNWESLDLEVIIAAAAMLIMFWRMNASNIKRTDDLIGSVRTEMGQLRAEMGQLRAEMGQMRAEMGQMQGQINQLQVQNGKILERIEIMQSHIDDLRHDMRKVNDSITDLNSRVSHFEGLIQPRPWVEAPSGDLPPGSVVHSP